MAKSIRMHDAVENGAKTLPIASFWEHWFETQAQKHQFGPNLDEHSIWENAVNFGILALEKAKS